LLFFASTFTGAAGKLTDYITQSYLPASYVMVLLVQFLVILADRIIYLCRSVMWKLIMQYSTLILYNVMMLWVFPSEMQVSLDKDNWGSIFSMTGPLRVLFLFKCVYWWISARQIRDGYPMVAGERILMRSYDIVPYAVFMVYRTIPFVYDLRTILDWTFIPTTLMFWDYLKVEDIYCELYRVASTVLTQPKRKPGDDRPLSEKITMGCSMVALMAAVLWLPLLLLSASLPGLQGVTIVPVSSGVVNIGLENHVPFYNQALSSRDLLNHNISEADFNKLRETFSFLDKDSSHIQVIELPMFSESVWEMTAAGRSELSSELKNESTEHYFACQMTLRRDSASSNVIDFDYRLPLDDMDIRMKLANILDKKDNSSLRISGVIPRVIKMPGTSTTASNLCTGEFENKLRIELELAYHHNDTTNDNYWSIKQIPIKDTIFDSDKVAQVVLVNTPVSAGNSILGTLAAYGLIGLYGGVVLYVANIVRGFTSNWTQRIMFWNLPDPRRLMRLCQDIILARMDGDLLLEEELSNELLQIYRSPESLIENTRLIVSPDEDGNDERGLDDAQDDDDDDDDDDDGFPPGSQPSHLRHRRAGQY